jgi:TP901 family phage tail tape measure protein
MSDGKVVYEVRADDSKLSSDLDKSNDTVKKSSGKMAGAAKMAGAGIAGALVGAAAASIKFGMEFETSFTKATTLMEGTDVNLEMLEKNMLKLSDSTGVAATELSEGLYSALSAGIPITENAEEALEFLELSTKLAKAGFTDVDTAISATAKTLNAYGLETSEAARIQDVLVSIQNLGITTVDELGGVLSNVTPTAAAMGVSFEQVGAALAEMTAQGTPAAQATTQLNSLMAELGKSGTKASNGLNEALIGTEHAGKSFQELMAEGVPMNEVLDLLGESAEETGLTMLDMFGSIEAGKAALAISGKNSENFAKSLDKMENASGSVDKAFETVSNTSKNKFDKAMNQLKNTAIGLFAAIEPILTTALPIFTSLLQQIAPIIQRVFEAIAPLIDMALPILMELIESLLGPLMQLVEALFPIVEVFIALLAPIMEIVLAIAGPLLGVLGELIGFLLGNFVESLELWGKVFTKVFSAIGKVAKPQIDALMGVLKGLMKFIKGVFSGDWKAAWEGLGDIFKSVFDGLKGMVSIPINFIIGAVNGVLKGLNGIKIPDWVPIVGGKSFSIKTIPKLKLANGGLAFGETEAVVGDNPNARHDPEVIAPLSKLKSMLGLEKFGSSVRNSSMSNVSIVITGNTISEDMDINTIGDQLTRKLQSEGVL